MQGLRPSETAGRSAVRAVLRDRRGAVAIEYGLLAAMIAIALVGMAAMTNVAQNQSQTYDTLSDSMSN